MTEDLDTSTRVLEDFTQAYELTLLQTSLGDWSISDDDDLALTSDGDLQVGSRAYNALFRLATLWRYNEPHFRYLFAATKRMTAWRIDLIAELNHIGDPSPTQTHPDLWKGYPEFAERLSATSEEEGVAQFGAETFAGCLILALSNALLRFKNDLTPGQSWKISAPLFNGYSVGQIVVAAANGFRHEDEWRRSRPPPHNDKRARNLFKKQRQSIDIISDALAEAIPPDNFSLARSVDILHLLSRGEYEVLASNVLQFANEAATTEERLHSHEM